MVAGTLKSETILGGIQQNWCFCKLTELRLLFEYKECQPTLFEFYSNGSESEM